MCLSKRPPILCLFVFAPVRLLKKRIHLTHQSKSQLTKGKNKRSEIFVLTRHSCKQSGNKSIQMYTPSTPGALLPEIVSASPTCGAASSAASVGNASVGKFSSPLPRLSIGSGPLPALAAGDGSTTDALVSSLLGGSSQQQRFAASAPPLNFSAQPLRSAAFGLPSAGLPSRNHYAIGTLRDCAAIGGGGGGAGSTPPASDVSYTFAADGLSARLANAAAATTARRPNTTKGSVLFPSLSLSRPAAAELFVRPHVPQPPAPPMAKWFSAAPPSVPQIRFSSFNTLLHSEGQHSNNSTNGGHGHGHQPLVPSPPPRGGEVPSSTRHTSADASDELAALGIRNDDGRERFDTPSTAADSAANSSRNVPLPTVVEEEHGRASDILLKDVPTDDCLTDGAASSGFDGAVGGSGLDEHAHANVQTKELEQYEDVKTNANGLVTEGEPLLIGSRSRSGSAAAAEASDDGGGEVAVASPTVTETRQSVTDTACDRTAVSPTKSRSPPSSSSSSSSSSSRDRARSKEEAACEGVPQSANDSVIFDKTDASHEADGTPVDGASRDPIGAAPAPSSNGEVPSDAAEQPPDAPSPLITTAAPPLESIAVAPSDAAGEGKVAVPPGDGSSGDASGPPLMGVPPLLSPFGGPLSVDMGHSIPFAVSVASSSFSPSSPGSYRPGVSLGAPALTASPPSSGTSPPPPLPPGARRQSSSSSDARGGYTGRNPRPPLVSAPSSHVIMINMDGAAPPLAPQPQRRGSKGHGHGSVGEGYIVSEDGTRVYIGPPPSVPRKTPTPPPMADEAPFGESTPSSAPHVAAGGGSAIITQSAVGGGSPFAAVGRPRTSRGQSIAVSFEGHSAPTTISPSDDDVPSSFVDSAVILRDPTATVASLAPPLPQQHLEEETPAVAENTEVTIPDDSTATGQPPIRPAGLADVDTPVITDAVDEVAAAAEQQSTRNDEEVTDRRETEHPAESEEALKAEETVVEMADAPPLPADEELLTVSEDPQRAADGEEANFEVDGALVEADDGATEHPEPLQFGVKRPHNVETAPMMPEVPPLGNDSRADDDCVADDADGQTEEAVCVADELSGNIHLGAVNANAPIAAARPLSEGPWRTPAQADAVEEPAHNNFSNIIDDAEEAEAVAGREDDDHSNGADPHKADDGDDGWTGSARANTASNPFPFSGMADAEAFAPVPIALLPLFGEPSALLSVACGEFCPNGKTSSSSAFSSLLYDTVVSPDALQSARTVLSNTTTMTRILAQGHGGLGDLRRLLQLSAGASAEDVRACAGDASMYTAADKDGLRRRSSLEEGHAHAAIIPSEAVVSEQMRTNYINNVETEADLATVLGWMRCAPDTNDTATPFASLADAFPKAIAPIACAPQLAARLFYLRRRRDRLEEAWALEALERIGRRDVIDLGVLPSPYELRSRHGVRIVFGDAVAVEEEDEEETHHRQHQHIANVGGWACEEEGIAVSAMPSERIAYVGTLGVEGHPSVEPSFLPSSDPINASFVLRHFAALAIEHRLAAVAAFDKANSTPSGINGDGSSAAARGGGGGMGFRGTRASKARDSSVGANKGVATVALLMRLMETFADVVAAFGGELLSPEERRLWLLKRRAAADAQNAKEGRNGPTDTALAFRRPRPPHLLPNDDSTTEAKDGPFDYRPPQLAGAVLPADPIAIAVPRIWADHVKSFTDTIVASCAPAGAITEEIETAASAREEQTNPMSTSLYSQQHANASAASASQRLHPSDGLAMAAACVGEELAEEAVATADIIDCLAELLEAWWCDAYGAKAGASGEETLAAVADLLLQPHKVAPAAESSDVHPIVEMEEEEEVLTKAFRTADDHHRHTDADLEGAHADAFASRSSNNFAAVQQTLNGDDSVSSRQQQQQLIPSIGSASLRLAKGLLALNAALGVPPHHHRAAHSGTTTDAQNSSPPLPSPATALLSLHSHVLMTAWAVLLAVSREGLPLRPTAAALAAAIGASADAVGDSIAELAALEAATAEGRRAYAFPCTPLGVAAVAATHTVHTEEEAEQRHNEAGLGGGTHTNEKDGMDGGAMEAAEDEPSKRAFVVSIDPKRYAPSALTAKQPQHRYDGEEQREAISVEPDSFATVPDEGKHPAVIAIGDNNDISFTAETPKRQPSAGASGKIDGEELFRPEGDEEATKNFPPRRPSVRIAVAPTEVDDTGAAVDPSGAVVSDSAEWLHHQLSLALASSRRGNVRTRARRSSLVAYSSDPYQRRSVADLVAKRDAAVGAAAYALSVATGIGGNAVPLLRDRIASTTAAESHRRYAAALFGAPLSSSARSYGGASASIPSLRREVSSAVGGGSLSRVSAGGSVPFGTAGVSADGGMANNDDAAAHAHRGVSSGIAYTPAASEVVGPSIASTALTNGSTAALVTVNNNVATSQLIAAGAIADATAFIRSFELSRAGGRTARPSAPSQQQQQQLSGGSVSPPRLVGRGFNSGRSGIWQPNAPRSPRRATTAGGGGAAYHRSNSNGSVVGFSINAGDGASADAGDPSLEAEAALRARAAAPDASQQQRVPQPPTPAAFAPVRLPHPLTEAHYDDTVDMSTADCFMGNDAQRPIRRFVAAGAAVATTRVRHLAPHETSGHHHTHAGGGGDDHYHYRDGSAAYHLNADGGSGYGYGYGAARRTLSGRSHSSAGGSEGGDADASVYYLYEEEAEGTETEMGPIDAATVAAASTASSASLAASFVDSFAAAGARGTSVESTIATTTADPFADP